jgi:hypothetical protein
MKSIFPLFLMFFAPIRLEARQLQGLRIGIQQEKADLVVIALPSSIKDTNEVIPQDELWPPELRTTVSNVKERDMVRGVEASLDVLTVLKGDGKIKNVTLHYYRPELSDDGRPLINGPEFLSFKMPEKPCAFESTPAPGWGRTYLMFLKREPDGRYSPLVGQIDPINSIYQLAFPGEQCARMYACEKSEGKSSQ